MPGRLRSQPSLPERGQVAVGETTIDFTIVRSSERVRTIALSVKRDGEVRISVPNGTAIEDIRRLVAGRAGWIAKQQARIAAKPQPTALASGCRIPLLGDELNMEIVRIPGRKGTTRRDGQTLQLRIPDGLGGDEFEDFVRELLKLWYKLRAEEYLPGRVGVWAPIVGRSATSIGVGDQKRLWGSCSGTGALRFNFRLVMLRPELVDYVVVHELAHIVHHNHGPNFWALVERVMPDGKGRRAQLRGLFESLPI